MTKNGEASEAIPAPFFVRPSDDVRESSATSRETSADETGAKLAASWLDPDTRRNMLVLARGRIQMGDACASE
jgi:hypothetical protein